MTIREIDENQHSWMIEVVNDLRVYCREHGLRFCKEAFDQVIVTAMIELNMEPQTTTATIQSAEQFDAAVKSNVVSLGVQSRHMVDQT